MVNGCFEAASAIISWGQLDPLEIKSLRFNRLQRGIRELRFSSRVPLWSFAVGHPPPAAPLCLSILALLRDLVHIHKIYLFCISRGIYCDAIGITQVCLQPGCPSLQQIGVHERQALGRYDGRRLLLGSEYGRKMDGMSWGGESLRPEAKKERITPVIEGRELGISRLLENDLSYSP